MKFSDYKREVLKDEDIKREYDALALEYELISKIIDIWNIASTIFIGYKVISIIIEIWSKKRYNTSEVFYMNKSELESELKKLASKIKEITPATKIYLFGSYAYGTPNEDSDIDLCILTNENRRKLEILREIRRNVGDINYPLDILVYKTDEFNERVNNKYIMESKIYKDGVELLWV